MKTINIWMILVALLIAPTVYTQKPVPEITLVSETALFERKFPSVDEQNSSYFQLYASKTQALQMTSGSKFDMTKNDDGENVYYVEDFLNSIGVCVHVQHGQDASKLLPLLRYTGVRNVRDAADKNYNMSGLLTLHNEAGVKVVIGSGSGTTDVDLPAVIAMARELHEAGALLAVEGPNEPNNFGGLTFNGVKGGGRESWMPVALFQMELYKAIKSDSVLKNYPVFSVSETGAQTDNVGLQFLDIPKEAQTLMPDGTRYADYANVHNYMYHPNWSSPHDNQVWDAADPTSFCKVDGLYGNFGKTWMKKFDGYSEDELKALPKVTTETGVRVGGEITEKVQANNYLSVYLAQFARGWSYTFIYEFVDDPDGAFGFYHSDFKTPRLSAHYLHNFTKILSNDVNTSKRKPLKKLNFSIDNMPATTHKLLLQKDDGSYFLILWSEKINGSDNITIKWERPLKSVQKYDPTHSSTPIQSYQKIDKLDLNMSDHPYILEIKM